MGMEPCFTCSSHTSDLKNGSVVTMLPDTWYLSRPAYPSVFNQICTEIGLQYRCTGEFLKIRTQSFQNGSHGVFECVLVASKPIIER